MTTSLVVVGAGIKFISHLTHETKIHIADADKVLYLVNEPAMQEWLHQMNPSAESLDDIYFRYSLRSESYQAITDYILEVLRKKQRVCVVIYGHPTVFATPALNAVKQAKKEGYAATILPGISAEACLFADLLIDPGSHGCLSYEATDLLMRQRNIDPSCHIIVWQVSVIGALTHPLKWDNSKGAELLFEYLLQFYPSDYLLTLYSAAQYPGFSPIIQQFKLDTLPHADFSRLSTLYIPPAFQAESDLTLLNKLR
jgi:tetrapyrrole methylase family protein/MazG family protein